MVNISKDAIAAFNESNRQVALIEVTAGGKTFTITESDIIQGGLKIDRYCVTNSKIEIGSAVAAELSLKLRNYDGKFNDVSFEGATLNVKIGIVLGQETSSATPSKQNVVYVPCGFFIVDSPPRKLSTISLSALDYMVKFDREVNASAFSFPIHVDALIQKICSVCNVTLATDVSVLPNHYFSIGSLPDTNQTLTYRQLLQWCAQLTGTCAFMNHNGELVLKWYEQTEVTITTSERYSSDMLENDITITGFTCNDSNGNTYLSGSTGYTLDLSDCGFLTNTYEGVLKELQTARGGFTYRPYSATIKSAPYLFPLDMIHYKDKDGIVHDTIVTNVTLALNCNTTISGAGETVTSSSYMQSTSGVTNQQAATDRANLDKINQSTNQTNQNKQDLKQFKTQYSSDLEKTNAAIESRVTLEVYQTDMNGISTRIGTAETKINQNAGEIVLRATKEEVASAKSDAIKSAAADATSKANAAESSANEYTSSQLKITNEKIESKVSKGDISSSINQTEQSVQIEASKINLKGAVTADSIAAEGLDAKVIKAGTITATEIKADTITAKNLKSGQIFEELWSNESESEFPEQIVELDMSAKYSELIIVFKGYALKTETTTNSTYTNTDTYYSKSSVVIPLDLIGDGANVGDGFCMFMNFPKAHWYKTVYKNGSTKEGFDLYTGNSAAYRPLTFGYYRGYFLLIFSDAYVSVKGLFGTDQSIGNKFMVPYKIYGVK